MVFNNLVADGENIAWEDQKPRTFVIRLLYCKTVCAGVNYNYIYIYIFKTAPRVTGQLSVRILSASPAWTIMERCVPSAWPSGKRSTNNGSCAKIALPTHQLPQMARRRKLEEFAVAIHTLNDRTFAAMPICAHDAML